MNPITNQIKRVTVWLAMLLCAAWIATGAKAAPPQAPGNLRTWEESSSWIDLGWDDYADNESGFIIERAPANSGPWSVIATNAANATSDNDLGLAPSTTYYYRVKAYNPDGSSDYTDISSSTTLGSDWLAESLYCRSDGKLLVPWVNHGNGDGQVSVWRLNSNAVFEAASSYGPYSDWLCNTDLVGFDGKIRLWWRRGLWWLRGGEISLWTLNSNGVFEAAVNYGPYAGWFMMDGRTGSDNKIWLLWKGEDHSTISVWTLNSNAVFQTANTYGPYTGWRISGASSCVGPDSKLRHVWVNDSGAISLWTFGTGGTYESSKVYGPFAGWAYNSHGTTPDGKVWLLWRNQSGAISLWRLSSGGDYETSATYGPYAGWVAGGFKTRMDNKLGVGWFNTVTGATCLWLVSNAGVYETSTIVGPFAGWSMQQGTFDSGNRFHIVWRNVNGAISLWRLSPTLTLEATANYGPY